MVQVRERRRTAAGVLAFVEMVGMVEGRDGGCYVGWVLRFRDVDHEEKKGRASMEARGSVIGASSEERDIVLSGALRFTCSCTPCAKVVNSCVLGNLQDVFA